MPGFDQEQLGYLDKHVRGPIGELTRGFDTLAEHRVHVNGELERHEAKMKAQGEALEAHASACPVVRMHSRFVYAAITAAAIGLVGLAGALL